MDTVVSTRQGKVRGSESEGVVSFKGIPYAAPPFGPNRFQPPRPAASWEGVRDALTYGPTVLKPPYFPPFDAILPEPAIPGEDCLNLNIWTPASASAQSKLPVLVWIHGGAFANGSGAVPTYDGTRFARDGVVCVTINYRLGVDGFLALGDGIVNLGLLDQIAALLWVQENSAAFGGDPDNVTIAGESAGGMSVSTLLSMPRAEGLFRRAIAESGAGHHAISAETARRVGVYLAEKLGIEPTREAFAAVPFDTLLQAQVALSADVFNRPDPAFWGEVSGNLMPFEPVIDGDILPVLPIQSISAGAGRGIDVLIGTNTEEQRLFMVPNGTINHITEEVLVGTVAAYGLPVDKTLDTYQSARPDATSGDLLAAIITDWFYRVPAIRVAEAHSAGPGKTYMYEFAWRSPQFSGQLGACHALEIAFAFDNLDQKENAPLMGSQPPQQLADTMHRAWVNFATCGDPGWPRYDLNQRATMRFDTASEVVNDPGAAERSLWEGKR
ncbi:MAG TPA: carboxylesterase/lipase family protein [Ktedonobacteraceae bacterium]|nr:carboxylesterase/lipase family protein [Ktedonobacteraceae bacterium]